MRAIGAQRWLRAVHGAGGDLVLGLVFGARARSWAACVMQLLGTAGHPREQRGALLLLLGPAPLPHPAALGNIVAAFVIVVVVSAISTFYPAFLATRVSPAAGDADGRVKPCASSSHRLAQPRCQHRRRTLLLGGAIAGVTAPARRPHGPLQRHAGTTMLESATTLMSGHVNVGGFYKVTAGPGRARGHRLPEAARAVSARRCPSWTTSSSAGAAGRSSSATPARMQVGVGGIDIDDRAGLPQGDPGAQGNAGRPARSPAPS